MLYYVIIGSYILLYIGMITYDLCHKDPAETPVKAEEEEVDISEEASQFKPVEVSKDIPELQMGKPKATASDETKQPQQAAKAEQQEQKAPRNNLSSLQLTASATCPAAFDAPPRQNLSKHLRHILCRKLQQPRLPSPHRRKLLNNLH
jgi:hypothetical protein